MQFTGWGCSIAAQLSSITHTRIDSRASVMIIVGYRMMVNASGHVEIGRKSLWLNHLRAPSTLSHSRRVWSVSSLCCLPSSCLILPSSGRFFFLPPESIQWKTFDIGKSPSVLLINESLQCESSIVEREQISALDALKSPRTQPFGSIGTRELLLFAVRYNLNAAKITEVT